MKCKCGGELWADNQKVTRFLACIKCKQWYEIIEYTPPKQEIKSIVYKIDVKRGD